MDSRSSPLASHRVSAFPAPGSFPDLPRAHLSSMRHCSLCEHLVPFTEAQANKQNRDPPPVECIPGRWCPQHLTFVKISESKDRDGGVCPPIYSWIGRQAGRQRLTDRQTDSGGQHRIGWTIRLMEGNVLPKQRGGVGFGRSSPPHGLIQAALAPQLRSSYLRLMTEPLPLLWALECSISESGI